MCLARDLEGPLLRCCESASAFGNGAEKGMPRGPMVLLMAVRSPRHGSRFICMCVNYNLYTVWMFKDLGDMFALLCKYICI